MNATSHTITTHTSARIVIIGGGVSGLSTAVRLAQAGFPVTVLEASRLGHGASTRNQGWLHSGAWFAPQRRQLAQMCYESLQQTLQFCPECVEENPAPMIYLTSQHETEPDRWTTAWDAAEIPYECVSSEELFERCPGLSISQVQHAFQLPDHSIRTDLLLSRLAETAENAGVEIRSGSPVARLLYQGQSVQGVEISSGEMVPARFVVLAGNAKGGALYPGFGAEPVGAESDIALTALKTHLVGVRPLVSQWPLCVVDADGFNHLPHRPMSVFGTNRWLPVRHGEDEQVIPAEVERIWKHVRRLFPDLQQGDHRVIEWAGTTVQAMRVEEIQAAQIPQPTVVDHQRESPRVENLVSVFPGRATLWPHVADETCAVVRAKLGTRARKIARPPWGTPCDDLSDPSLSRPPHLFGCN